MPWNWELPDWPKFKYDPNRISQSEKKFLVSLGSASAFLKNIDDQEQQKFIVEILSLEGIESSKIEGEILERESLQSSIKKHFGLQTNLQRGRGNELGMGELLCNVYQTFNAPLTHEMLWEWHAMLFSDSSKLEEHGQYRTHPEPMQIVSGRLDHQTVFFEAPPSNNIFQEMTTFIHWFNTSTDPILGKAALAHVYFESIHPFEDGNGRIGRVLVEKILSQGAEQPILVAVSHVIEKRKKQYYSELERCNKTLNIQHWVDFFAEVILQAQEESMQLLQFLIGKSKILTTLKEKLNSRQEKVLLRMFAEGIDGFSGGLSAENYISITNTSRATATRDLADLVDKGALLKIGEFRHTRYRLNLTF